jgi:hypothetical protein
MEPGSLPTTEKPPKLRWYQWRLRSLFILTLLVAIGMSWLTVTIREQRRQQAAAAEITKAGGWVTSEQTWLGKLLRDNSLARVTEVLFIRKSMTDAVLVHLEGLSELRTLWVYETQFTDAGLVHLRGLRRLQTLVLSDTQITDAGLVHLQGLSQLHLLRLDGTRVTAKGVKELQKALPNCKISR